MNLPLKLFVKLPKQHSYEIISNLSTDLAEELSRLKVGSCCFKCVVVLLIYFFNCRQALFTSN